MALDDRIRELAEAVAVDVKALQGGVRSDEVSVLWVGTRAGFEAVVAPDPGTVYLITEG